ncbi:hypothetical protein GCM10011612_02490 [Actinomyces gaoshouyii]|uniref:Uncharacterized protein n=1 Tax=Actinomyces gaoshouyii TaxID=1960083 RepID=A0A8H9H7D3_9ACTO|nr:hypothetical protein GCM10011612_02490 [Actinomyces gaoshouyii]
MIEAVAPGTTANPRRIAEASAVTSRDPRDATCWDSFKEEDMGSLGKGWQGQGQGQGQGEDGRSGRREPES